MNTQQKIKFEQQAVVGLLVIFGITFMMGPAKNLGLFRSPMRSDTASTSTPTLQSLPVLIQQYGEKIEPKLELQPMAPQAAPVGQATYTAQTLRDPLRSLLPPEQKPTSPMSSGGGGSSSSKPLPMAKPTPPPALKLQGLVWGSSLPKAIIDNQLYGVGDAIHGVTILSIDRNGITVDYNGTSLVYSMPVVSDKGRGSNVR